MGKSPYLKKNGPVVLGWLVLGWMVVGLSTAQAQEVATGSGERQPAEGQQVIIVEARTTTWIRRGRTLMDVAPLVRKKLASAGFQVVSKATDSQLLMKVDYREERGKQFRIDNYGTNIICHVNLGHSQRGTLLDFTIRESSGEANLGTPPYIEAMQNFETNPYFYFLGDLVKGRVLSDLDTTGSLIQGLGRLMDKPGSEFDSLSAPHTMLENESGYATEARNNIIQELGRLGDPRAVPTLTSFLNHADARVRHLSVQALGAIGAPASRRALEGIARSDPDRHVREAAGRALATLGSN